MSLLSDTLFFLPKTHFSGEKKLNDNQSGFAKRCSGAVLVPNRFGGGQALMSRMVSDRVSIQIYTD